MPAPGGPIPEGMVGPIKARGSGDQPSATRRVVPGRRPAALPTTGRLVAAGCRRGRKGLGKERGPIPAGVPEVSAVPGTDRKTRPRQRARRAGSSGSAL